MNKQDRKDLNKAINSRRKWYVGHYNNKLEAFCCFDVPTPFCYPYGAVIGPFRTKRAALWAEKYGFNNPHFQTVNDAEQLSKL